MGVAVVLTAAVVADPRFSVVQSDAADRESQYRRALRWWQCTAADNGWRLVFVESSGYAESTFIDFLCSSDGAPVLYLGFHPTAAQVRRGKGAVESAMMGTAIDALGDEGFRGTVYKVTGRLVVSNASLIFVDPREDSVICRRVSDFSRIDVRCVGASMRSWELLLKAIEHDIDEQFGGDFGEVLAARVVGLRNSRAVTVSSFARRPNFQGSSGTRGERYDTWALRLRSVVAGRFEGLVSRLVERKSI